MPSNNQYLIQCENELAALVSSQDRDNAGRLLNEILGCIYFADKNDINTVRVRLCEIAVLLSRVAINAGGDVDEILDFNRTALLGLSSTDSFEELSLRITDIMHRFMRYTFDFSSVKHADTVEKIVRFIKSRYNEKLTLDDIADAVMLSRSYVSSLFKNEMGETLFSYINRVRVEKSKSMLLNENLTVLQISEFCGFDDQSYYTKIFKSLVGVSPKKYRECRGRINPL